MFLHSQAGQQVRTNNHVERANRKLRYLEKVRYKWRQRPSIIRFVLLEIDRWQRVHSHHPDRTLNRRTNNKKKQAAAAAVKDKPQAAAGPVIVPPPIDKAASTIVASTTKPIAPKEPKAPVAPSGKQEAKDADPNKKFPCKQCNRSFARPRDLTELPALRLDMASHGPDRRTTPAVPRVLRIQIAPPG